MLLGYNHNVNYKDSVFHIQTEDSGIKNPHIITLLYREGVILCSKKTSYADILKIDNLEAVVEDLMKEQHKDMLRRLKSGEFDDKAFGASLQPAITLTEALPAEAPPVVPTPSKPSSTTATITTAAPAATPLMPTQLTEPTAKKQEAVSLDDAILSFFGASK